MLLILAGITLNYIIGNDNLFNTSDIAVSDYNKKQIQEKIELNILGLMLENKGNATIDEIIDELIKTGITTEETSDREDGTIITEEGYFVEIIKQNNGKWEVVVGEKGKPNIRLNCIKDTEELTGIVKVQITGKLLNIGIKQLIFPDGISKEYTENTINIEANILHARAEELSLNPEFRESFDLAVSRAVAPLNILLEYCLP